MVEQSLFDKIIFNISLILCLLSVPCFFIAVFDYGFWFYIISGSIMFFLGSFLVTIFSFKLFIKFKIAQRNFNHLDGDWYFKEEFNRKESFSEETKEEKPNKKSFTINERRLLRIINISTSIIIILFIVISFFMVNDISFNKKHNSNTSFNFKDTTYYEYKTDTLVEDIMLEPLDAGVFVIYKYNKNEGSYSLTKKTYGYYSYIKENNKLNLHITVEETYNKNTYEWDKSYPDNKYLYFNIERNNIYIEGYESYLYKKVKNPLCTS